MNELRNMHSTLAIGGVSSPLDSFVVAESSVLRMKFGAKTPRQYPVRFGAWNQLKEPWYVQLLFPILRSKDPKSELHAIKTKQDYDPSIDFKEYLK